jgi:ribonuclease E
MGVIIRTAGLERSKQELQRDMTYLLKLWETIGAQAQDLPAPSVVYQERDLVIRSIRDYFTPDIAEILVDDREVFKRAREFLQAIMPRYVNRIKLSREKRPIFSRYQLEEQIEAIFEDKIPLKSGGSIVIERTEAMVSIDVNSGRSTQERGMEETAFKTNLEAAEEIARQLRLRDLGGLIVIDFIDMRDRKHMQEVERCLKNALKRDKARVEVSRISKFGLLELSRQRLKPALQDETYLPCPHCTGQGLIRSPESLGLSVLRKIQGAAVKGSMLAARAKVPFDVANYLLNQKRERLLNLEREYDIRIQIEGDAALAGSQVQIAFDKRETPLVDESALPVSIQTAPELEEAEAPPVDVEEDIEDVEVEDVDEESPESVETPEAPEAVEPVPLEETAPAAATAAEPAAAASIPTETNGSPAHEGTASSAPENGGATGRVFVPPSRRRMPRYGRFWWLRRRVPAMGGPGDGPPEERGHFAQDGPSNPAAESVSAPAPLGAFSDATPPGSRMVAPLTPPHPLPSADPDMEPTEDPPPAY